MHIAIVSLGYPPIRHVAGTRAARMARELSQRHRVTVVTVDWRRNRDDIVDDHNVHVIRVDPRRWFAEFEPERHPIQLERAPTLATVRRARTATRMFRWGSFAPWARSAYAELRARHRNAPIDVVWAIHGDDSAHEIGYRFHRASGVPWVADFKDPWDQFYPPSVRRLQRFLTKRRLSTAACLTSTIEEQARIDAQTFDKEAKVIWTSYEHELLGAAVPERASSAFSMLYIGHFGEKHNLPALAETLRRVHDGAGTAPVEFHVFGHAVDIIRPHLRKAGVESMLVAHDFVSQSEAYGFMRAADALILLPTANHAAGVAVGVKELEYFASGSPVICIGPLLNEMRPLVEQLPAVRQCAGPSEAARTILDELGRFVRGAPSLLRGVPNPPPLAAHTWSEKARALEDVLVRAARTTASA